MAFNGRRNGGSAYMANSAASIGQRRPLPNPQQLTNNFVPGGQLTQPNKPLLQMPGHQQHGGQQQNPQVQRQQQPQLNMRQQAQQYVNQQQMQSQPPPPLQPQAPPPQQQVQQPKIVFKNEEKSPAAPPAPVQPPPQENTNDNETEDDIESAERRLKKKPFWMKRDGFDIGKINKKERLRRRNQRLRKILQPKNALMVLNELVGSTPYKLTENADIYDGVLFKCAVLVDGTEHVGLGKSKPSAKAAAAEAALKHLVLNNLKNPMDANSSTSAIDSDGDVKMDPENDDNLSGISWSHVACYALHKLLSSWDEGSFITEKLVQAATSSTSSVTSVSLPKPLEKKPAKKLPENANIMNPTMLLNQMHPNVAYEEISKVGNPPHVQFTIRCVVNGQAFVGTGTTKKTARKMCAFAACHQILQIQYCPSFLEENGVALTDNGFVSTTGQMDN